MTPSYTIRAAEVREAEVIQQHRRAMFSEMGYPLDAKMHAMSVAFLPWLRLRMENGEYRGWFAIARDGSVAAGLGLWLMDWPPHMIGPGSPRGNILNVYTESGHRRRGLARALMLTAIDWCRANGIRAVILHASAEGRGLYESLGFQATNEMRLMLGE
jgi:GNAT superfamily N-acetyltransferase